MREMVSVSLGQCGTQLGYKFWEVLCDEHGIDPTGTYRGESDLQLERINVFFNEATGGKYVPRSVLVDLEPSVLGSIRSYPFGQVFRPDNFIFGRTGAGNNWAKGHYTEGAELMDAAMDIIRREAETCCCMQGFQFIHSIGGGCGSGMGALLLEAIKRDYPKEIIVNYTVFPSSKTSETVVEPYNSILSLPSLIDYSDLTFCIDNEALHEICHGTLKLFAPSYPDMNHIVAMAMTGASACFRFPTQHSCDYKKLIANLVPFPALHFVVPGFVPLTSRGVQPYRALTVPDLVQQMFDANILMSYCDPTKGKFITVGGIFRGRMSTREVEETLIAARDTNRSYFIESIPDHIKSAICDIPPRGLKMAATIIVNNTSTMSLCRRMRNGFSAMLKRKAYLHWYIGEGMTEQDFAYADTAVAGLLSEYKKIEEMKCGDDSDNDDDDDEDDKDD